MKAKATELRRRFEQLKAQRTPLESTYRKLQRYLLPESGRFYSADKKENSDTGYEYILDATATDAIDTLGAGMLGGMTSPARPWFRLTTRNAELDERSDVKKWLADAQREMLMVFAKSNVYQALNNAYLELAVYGTACLVALPSSTEIIHLHEMTAGEYWLEEDSERRVNTMYREIIMTATQMVEQFGEDNCSERVRKAYKDHGTCFNTFRVIHCIEPRENYDQTKRSQQEMPYRSVYFEAEPGETGHGEERTLLEEGFQNFPVLAPRWSMSKRSAYGRSPGMKALGTVKRLQEKTEHYERAIDYSVNPALLVPSSFQAHPLDLGPGGISFVDINTAQQVQSAFNVQMGNGQQMEMAIERDRKAINDYFYKDLFLMLAQTARYGRTAYEVEKLDKEKMMIMGPVLERLHAEVLDPLISCCLDYMYTFGKLPPIPDSMLAESSDGYGLNTIGTEESDRLVLRQGVNVEYVSVLAQAQRAAGVDSMNQYVQNLMGASQIFPEVVDNFDYDKWANTLADQLGVDPELIRSSDDVEELRAQRAEAQQQAAQMSQMQQGAAIAKDLNQAGLTQNNGANLLEGLQGY